MLVRRFPLTVIFLPSLPPPPPPTRTTRRGQADGDHPVRALRSGEGGPGQLPGAGILHRPQVLAAQGRPRDGHPLAVQSVDPKRRRVPHHQHHRFGQRQLLLSLRDRRGRDRPQLLPQQLHQDRRGW
ncbi:hypothetical protein chiPu_0030428 [Chiloscyllium punctatum]|uniref:Uncharacterized protein n=1 Tax=Chiloscyllium punctatum TaxID=137246 RepID=A0A401TUI1_CHIPU|nr:hypothetical protein [Chiloscyllium punctatum]